MKNTRRLINAACVMTLIALGLMSWSLFDPRPIPIVIAMSGEQAFGMDAFALYTWVLISTLRRARVLDEQRDQS